MFIDTHCHFSGRSEQDKERVYNEALKSGVGLMIDTAFDMKSSEEVIEFSASHEGVYAAVGVHPDASKEITPENIKVLKKLSENKKCVLIGEIGLDYHYEPYDKELQKKAFISQMELADEVNLPFTVHSRDCTADLIKILTENKKLIKNGAIMHCYSGSVETAEILLNLGFYMSFSGTLTFKNARNLPEVVKFLPMDRILSETDSPYLSPVPLRGTENESKNVLYVTRKIAEIKNIDVEKTADIIKSNVKTLLKKIDTI